MSKRLLQIVLAVLSLSPLSFGTLGALKGGAWLAHGMPVHPDLDSHFRYVSGIFLFLGVALLTCIPRIEERTERFRLIAFAVMLGGLARLVGVLTEGAPGTAHLVGLGVELIVTPLVVVWQARVSSAARPVPR